MNYSRGQIALGTIGIIASLIAGVGAPFIYFGKIVAVNDVQSVQIITLQETAKDTRDEIKEIKKTLMVQSENIAAIGAVLGAKIKK